MVKIKKRERNAIIQSLLAGVVPRIGLQHIQVGRKDEITAILTDLEHIRDEGASIRFIIGQYGSGKSFFLNLSRQTSPLTGVSMPQVGRPEHCMQNSCTT